jgi:hypothetical protein
MKRRLPANAAVFSAALAVASAAAASGAPTHRVPSQESKVIESHAKVMEVGKAFVKQKFPDFSEERKKPVVHDKGESWEFTYELPADMLGGAPVVVIKKSDMSVTRSFRYQ